MNYLPRREEAKRKGVFSVEGKMHSLHNLTLPMMTFELTEEEKERVSKNMNRCSRCRRWKYVEELSQVHKECTVCREKIIQ